MARRKLRMIHQARVIQDLSVPPGNRLGALKGNLKGFWVGLQADHDLEAAERSVGKKIASKVSALV